MHCEGPGKGGIGNKRCNIQKSLIFAMNFLCTRALPLTNDSIHVSLRQMMNMQLATTQHAHPNDFSERNSIKWIGYSTHVASVRDSPVSRGRH